MANISKSKVTGRVPFFCLSLFCLSLSLSFNNNKSVTATVDAAVQVQQQVPQVTPSPSSGHSKLVNEFNSLRANDHYNPRQVQLPQITLKNLTSVQEQLQKARQQHSNVNSKNTISLMKADNKANKLLQVQQSYSQSQLISHVNGPLAALSPEKQGHEILDFVDNQGRQVLFRGFSAVVKGPPWVPITDKFHPHTSLSEKDFALLRDMGYNFVRLGTMWAGLQPINSTHFNESYLDEVEKVVTLAAQHGMYTILDMHQDVLSEYFCGEGIPRWWVDSMHHNFSWWNPLKYLFADWLDRFPAPLMKPFGKEDLASDGFPSRQNCKKLNDKVRLGADQSGYATEAHGSAVEKLLKTNLTHVWGRAWAHIAKRFKGNTNVLSLELLNEPFAGNPYTEPIHTMLPWLADGVELQNAYDILNQHIREVDNDVILFFAGVTWEDLGQRAHNFGFTHVPGGDLYANRSALAYHFYVPPEKKNSTLSYIDDFVYPNAAKMKTGMFYTEGPRYDSVLEEREYSQMLEQSKRGFNWGWWEVKNFCVEDPHDKNATEPLSQNGVFGACKTGYGGGFIGDDGLIENRKAIQYNVRMHPLAVQGQLQWSFFSSDDNVLEFVMDPDFSRNGSSTEVFIGVVDDIPKDWFANEQKGLKQNPNSMINTGNQFRKQMQTVTLNTDMDNSQFYGLKDSKYFVASQNLTIITEPSDVFLPGAVVRDNILYLVPDPSKSYEPDSIYVGISRNPKMKMAELKKQYNMRRQQWLKEKELLSYSSQQQKKVKVDSNLLRRVRNENVEPSIRVVSE